MSRLENPQLGLSDSKSRSNSLSDQASTLLNERSTLQTNTKRESVGSSISFDSNVYEKAGSCTRADNACAWRPDDSSQSAKTNTWRAQRDAQREKPLDAKDGKYEVKPGDTMNDIAKRYLKDNGMEPTAKDVDKVSRMLADQNKDQYSLLKCNPNLIRPGMKLDLPPSDKIGGVQKAPEVSGLQNYKIAPGSWSGEVERREDGLYAVPGKRPDVEIQKGGRPSDTTGWKSFDDLNRRADEITKERPGECRREDGFMNLPEQFRSPKDILKEMPFGGPTEMIQLPFNFRTDKPGKIMQLPFRPSEDSKGKIMQADFAIDNAPPKDNSKETSSIIKRMLDHIPLPEVMLV